MINPQQIESIVETISQTIPPGVGKLPESLRQNLKQSLASTFEKMDLVSRQEFDIQTGVLAKTRAKLEALEKQVAALEAQQKND
ncbi:accessory factor UbiK family protein [Hydrogenovibrio sp. 3SP14C1]|uniref:accessory factor UbiK family protein n=1 Tax=Hydrogenovibrio sp. 3SP14C1 TaxID=3038774 RepID=UPI002416AF08|nr:accessory factor UbiK family protein [Hydrogenovibrio sp. 3SP14C1]MDG4813226.1 accessory factor UbiK family protein [Hydrogenovibrio sp. 3SP14C1]